MTDTSVKSPIKSAIWLTCHSRMVAEKRYRRYENISHLLLSWLSLSVIAWAVVRNSQHPSLLLDTYTAVLSVLVFALSIITFGFRFGEVAASHRECYLRLQKLHDCETNPSTLAAEYHEILGAYGNHSDRDFETLILERTLFGHRRVQGKDGQQIPWTGVMLMKATFRVVTFWLIVSIFFALGLVPYYLIFKAV